MLVVSPLIGVPVYLLPAACAHSCLHRVGYSPAYLGDNTFTGAAALMQDQASNFQRLGVQADYLCSTRSDSERQLIIKKLQGSTLGLQLLLVTPESLSTDQ